MSEGNYLRKTRKNVFVSADCVQMWEELSRDEGLSHSGIIERATRIMYRLRFGDDKKPDTPRQFR